jgi:hypothetical protein
MHYCFHVNVFVRPEQTSANPPIDLRGVRVTPLCAVDGRPLTFDALFSATFEEALSALAKLPRVDAEPDGFFVIAGGQGASHWSVSGHLFDFGGCLHRVELNGDCPAESFDAILTCFGGPSAPLAFELVQEGVALDGVDFRAWAGRGSPGDA